MLQYEQKLIKQHELWEQIHSEGQRDSIEYDGQVLNRIRQEIEDTRQKAAESLAGMLPPDVYHKETPPKVDETYMARPESIRAGANSTYYYCLRNSSLAYLKQQAERLPKQQADSMGITELIGQVDRLRDDIVSDNLIGMRKRMDPNSILWNLTATEKLVREQLPPTLSQMRLQGGYEAMGGDGGADHSFLQAGMV